MKQKLRLGDSYALTKHKRKQTTIRYISLLAVLMSMCLYAVKQVSAQQAEPAATAVANIKPLQIGDTVPEWLWHHPLQVVNHPEGKDTITLNDYRGKLIILDFWATWCKPCLDDFPKQERLQDRFGDSITFVKITSQDKERITLPVFTVAGDVAIKKLIPYRLIPHYAWINETGELVATSDSSWLTDSMVNAVLRGNQVTAKMKIDRNKEKPLMSDITLSDHLKHYAFFYSGKLDGYGASVIPRNIDGQQVGLCVVNRPILEIYMSALIPMFEQLGDRYSVKRNIIPETIHDSLYSVDVIVSPDQTERLPHIFLDLVNGASPYTGRVTRETVDCLVLTRIPGGRDIGTKGGASKSAISKETATINNMPIWVLSHTLNNRPGPTDLPIIDETGYDGPIDMVLEDITTFTGLVNGLRKHGLDLTQEKREINMFTLIHKKK